MYLRVNDFNGDDCSVKRSFGLWLLVGKFLMNLQEDGCPKRRADAGLGAEFLYCLAQYVYTFFELHRRNILACAVSHANVTWA